MNRAIDFVKDLDLYAGYNCDMRLCYLIIVLAGLTVSCSPVAVSLNPSQTNTPSVMLTGYSTLTPTSTLPVVQTEPTPTQPPPPTATPFTHIVKKDETMLGIAFKYGVKLEDLLAANPSINPRLLSIGTVLVIPLNGGLVAPQPTATLLRLGVSKVTCYATRDGNLACFSEISNNEEIAYDNLGLQFEVYTQNGELLHTQYAAPPIDRLAPGVTLPVFTTLPVPTTDVFTVNLRALTALIIPSDSQRYVDITLRDVEIQHSTDGLRSRITGTVSTAVEVTSLWLVGTAYDQEDNPVGIRRVILHDPCHAIATPPTVSESISVVVSDCTGGLPFDFSVYSLGPKIERVEIFSEGHR